jgi:hypothetical protein
VIALADAFQALLAIFDRLEIIYLVGGSVASGTHGLPRQTNDIDIVADLPRKLVPTLCESLTPAFYVDAGLALRAVKTGSSFNAIHLKSAYKFDIFPAGADPFARSELSRRVFATSTITGLEDIEFPVASPEDTILSKLVWFRKGGESSDRQWHDILGVARVQASRLDHAYLEHWASTLGVADLLAKALS